MKMKIMAILLCVVTMTLMLAVGSRISDQRKAEAAVLAVALEDGSESSLPQHDDPLGGVLAQKSPNPIAKIVDRTKTEGLPYDMALEKFFEDGENEYYFSGIYSHYVIVHYADGSQEGIVTALNAGRATIADLDRFEVDYMVKALGNPW